MSDIEQLPGHVTSEEQLIGLGFSPLVMRLGDPIQFTGRTGIDWDSVGDVPDSPGHYLFTVESDDRMHVVYVGLTSHLWMVTKGLLPGRGGTRGGQRYGRPRHAGATRQRVNVLVAEQLALGRRVRHWVRAERAAPGWTAATTLRAAEEELILRWRLRETGWNRG